MSFEYLINTFSNIGIPHLISIEKSKNEIYITTSGVYNVINIPKNLRIFIFNQIYDLELVSVSDNGYIKSLIYKGSNDIFNSQTKTIKGGIFKTIYKELLNLTINYELPTLVQSEINNIENIHIRECDNPYLKNCGFTIEEILNTLGLNVILPYSINYNIVEFRVPTGSNPESVIRSLIPIPAIKIHQTYNDTFIVELPNFLDRDINSIINQLFLNNRICDFRFNEKTLKEVKNTIVSGYKSEPININSNFTNQIVETENYTYIKNPLGDIYMIIYKSTDENIQASPS